MAATVDASCADWQLCPMSATVDSTKTKRSIKRNESNVN
jgi:hypothetical protein